MSDSDDDAPLPGRPRPRHSLTQMLNDAPQPDTVANSCSEDESDDDASPLPLPLPRPAIGDKKMPAWLLNSVSSKLSTPPSHGVSRTVMPSKPSPALVKRPTPSVQTTPGYGGRLVYQVTDSTQDAKYYCVQWRKPQQKKHKTWDGDAWLRVNGNKITMIGEDGKTMGVGGLAGGGLPQEGQEFRIGSYDTEVDREVPYEEFKTATSILNKQGATPVPSFMFPSVGKAGPSRTSRTSFKPPSVVSKPKLTGGYLPARDDDGEAIAGPSAPPGAVVKPLRSGDFGMYAHKPEARTGGEKIVIGEKTNKERNSWGGALHDPSAEGAVVMPRPPEKWAELKKTTLLDVVIDPDLSCLMREHQKEGVKFMYSCVMGLSEVDGEGCILADEMGLGKSLQTVALIHTMLKQSPFKNQTSRLVFHNPRLLGGVTLVDNWRKEFRKWVDRRINVAVADGSNDSQISHFCNNRSQHVLIIGYERLRKVVNKLAACVPPIDLIVCDEGHRLKSKDNKTTKTFDELRTRRRIILSGTPLQNDLGEYWAMANFVNPGVLGRYSQFNRQIEKPILKSRAPGCSKKDQEEGQMRADELGETSSAFVLRRTADVLDNYLPPKHEYVVFVAPSKLQLAILDRLLSQTVLSAFLQARVQPLGFIDTLRKVCNAPLLLKKKADKEDIQYDENEIGTALEQAMSVMPRDVLALDASTSGKLTILERMLKQIHRNTPEKIVVVSNWTSTLDIIEEMLGKMHYPFLRLDGSTPQKARQGLVDQFNRGRREDTFVFLLSAKAGGTGLNLIGASRLVLFDSDWNPSTDLQAMARIHRDGQKRPVYIYRLLTACTIDEKIYQRQITKTGLSDQMLGKGTSEKSSNSFSDAELRDLFTLSVRTDGCQTHDLLGCNCNMPKLAEKDTNIPDVAAEGDHDSDSDDSEQAKFVPASQYDPTPTSKMAKKAAQEKKDKLAALKKWTHFDGFDRQSFDGITDTLLHSIVWADWDDSTPPKAAAPPSDAFDGIESDSENDSEENSSDEPRRKKQKTVKPANSKRLRHSVGMRADEARRHDLRDIADRGAGGRVMFMFEKVSKSKM